ncbi:Glutaminyl-tRNA synthetase [Pseudoloma neurophilia]|uniref:glutamine--tRNA ligase n=1 Tax=Pseudoloma neurophilia TaxID=146866 RepID=A0A0R0M0F6_9MICR|nr:Glutaminyl-tRNA synthetase [Pseudoloma neurophilia]
MSVQSIETFLQNLKISEKLKDQLIGKDETIYNLKKISEYQMIDKNLYYNLAIKMKGLNDDQVKDLALCISKDLIFNENMLVKGIELHLENSVILKSNYDKLSEYLKTISFDEKKLLKVLNDSDNLKDAMTTINKDNEMVFYDPKKVIEFLKANNLQSTKIKRKGILNEGELRKLHKPGENPQSDPKLMEEHLKRTGGKIITRFPPEPNGFLHIGHAKAMYLDFNYGDECILRYDDTNPKNESPEYYKSILEDVEWMGYKPSKITAASDYFDQLIDMAKFLIQKGRAYVCHLSTEDIKSQIISPFRDRPVELNAQIFQEMIDGKWKEGSAILRLKMDMDSKDMMLHDLIAYRIIDHNHYRATKKYYVYPSYDYTHCVNDSIEDITHSFCSREFFTRKSSYYWLIDALEIYKPVQWEFSRLNISNTILSKRKLNKLVNKGIVMGWDDPRLFTIRGLKRRGVPPEAIKKFVEKVGITFNETIIDVKIFEHVLRQTLMDKPVHHVIFNPINLKIEATQDEQTNNIFIDGGDFLENAPSDYLRLTPSQPVGLVNKFTVEYVKKENDKIIVRKTDQKWGSKVQWLENDNVKFIVRELSPLFNSFNPEEGESFMDDINPNSMEIIAGYSTEAIKNVKIGETVQFFRKGWYCRDQDVDGQIVFNKTIDMKR